MSIANAVFNMTDRREKLYRYVQHDLVPMLRSSGREELASGLEETLLAHGPSHLRRLPQESIEQLKEKLRLEIDKAKLDIKRGKVGEESHDTKIHQMVELIAYLPEHAEEISQRQETPGLKTLLKRVFSR